MTNLRTAAQQALEALHVVPLGGLREHIASKGCWCRPTEDEHGPMTTNPTEKKRAF